MNRPVLAYAALASATAGWALSPIFMRLMTGAYDGWTQAFLRYGFATLILLAISLTWYRPGLVAAFRRPKATLGLAILNAAMQTTWTFALYHTTATTAQLITKTQVLMVIAISYVIYHEERAVITNPRYIAGTLLGFLGVGGVLLEDPSVSLIPRIDLAAWLLLFTSVCWSIYAVWGKHIVKDLHPIPMFTAVATYTSTIFAINMLIFGEPGAIIGAGGSMLGLAAFSSVLPIAVAHAAYHYAQRQLGSAFCISVMLINPAVTNGLALLFWPDESMNWIQWTGAGVLTLGAYFVVQAQRRAGGAPAAEPVPPGSRV
jgi:drug/metabolite transporter (DMT)-like permease